MTKDFKLLSIDEEHQKAAIEQHSYFSTATLSADLYTCTSEDTTTLAMPTCWPVTAASATRPPISS